jgi:glutathione synthase/RimK-type ligase-like ATP-grasp enzyme
MIMLWGVCGDTPMANVKENLESQGQRVAFVDQHAILETEFKRRSHILMDGALRVGGEMIELDRVTAAYLRPYGLDQLPALQEFDRNGIEWQRANAVVESLQAWSEMTPARVVNRFSAMASNSSKPYQARLIEGYGFAVPETLITTDAEAVREFWLQHGTVIYKSISSVRSIVSRLTREHVDRLDSLHWCPTQFQQYIPGTDYRVHVVGEETFACEINSSGDDYRYAGRSGATASLRSCQLEPDVLERCLALARGLGLAVAGVDLRYHPAGQWFCFEVNPSPAFTYYQSATGLPIGQAIARLLSRGG